MGDSVTHTYSRNTSRTRLGDAYIQPKHVSDELIHRRGISLFHFIYSLVSQTFPIPLASPPCTRTTHTHSLHPFATRTSRTSAPCHYVIFPLSFRAILLLKSYYFVS